MYKKARIGQIQNFTGISDPYQKPEKPELVLDTDKEDIETSAQKVIDFLQQKGLV